MTTTWWPMHLRKVLKLGTTATVHTVLLAPDFVENNVCVGVVVHVWWATGGLLHAATRSFCVSASALAHAPAKEVLATVTIERLLF